jgi:putative ABC transport system substrate-binding protein
MRRRELITLLGGAAASLPLAALAQQPAMPVIGFLDSRSPEAMEDRLRGFHRGLRDAGYVEGENITIIYRWAETQFDRLPMLATELVSRHVAVITASGGAEVSFAAKAATTTIPVAFLSGVDPVRLGLVASLARPGGNLTGINFFALESEAKRLELLRELVPTAIRLAVLVNPANPVNAESTVKDVEPAARSVGLQIQVVKASNGSEIDAVFTSFARDRPDALVVGVDGFFNSRRVQLALLAGRHGIPAIYATREHADAGGLMSYGASIIDAYRQVSVYTGRVLKGAKPADLPVVQSTKFELVINAQTARTLGLEVPPTLLVRADEVIE